METQRLRDTTVDLPGQDPGDLDRLEVAPGSGDVVTDVVIGDDVWARADLARVSLSRSWLINADLSSIRWEVGAIDRCVFRGCTLVGANLNQLILKNVIFEDCRLDYANLSQLRTTSPTIFIGCSLIETNFYQSNLTAAAFDGCKLAATHFDECDLKGADMRGNDLAALTGVMSLRGARLSETQLAGLTEAVVQDLQLDLRGLRPRRWCTTGLMLGVSCSRRRSSQRSFFRPPKS
jgi:uncharacterized protein YjbI with pentapeptide repeats